MADDAGLRIGFVLVFFDEILRAGKGDLGDVFFDFILRHTDALSETDRVLASGLFESQCGLFPPRYQPRRWR